MSIGEKFELIADKVYDVGVTDGQKSEYDRFWDDYQDYGNRTDYIGAFMGVGWNAETFKPKYDIKPVKAEYMFAQWQSINYNNIDVAEALERAGKVLDTSNNTKFSYFLMYGSTSHMPVIDTRSATSLLNLSVNSSIKTIDKIILKDNGSQSVKTMFNSTHPALANVIIEGVVGNDINLQTCPKLTVESLISFLKALKDFTGSTDEYTRTINLTAAQWTLLDNEGATAPGGVTWEDYVNNKKWLT